MATQRSIFLPKPWQNFLRGVDARLSQTVNLHCVGAFVLVALYGIPRYTGDLDYIEVLPPEAASEVEKIGGRGSPLHTKYKLFLQSVGIADLPEEYESRLEEIELKLENLKLWALDPYDLLLSKVPRNSPKDQDDANYLISKLKLGFETFENRWKQEMASWIANRGRHELTIELWKKYFPKS